MATRKSASKRRRLRAVSDAEIDDAIAQLTTVPIPESGTAPLHELFNRQVREVIDASDLDEEEKQSILVAMACPCCGGGPGMLTYKLKKGRSS